MQKLIRQTILFALFALAATLFSCSDGSSGSDSSENQKNIIVCFGNSLTAGYGASVPDEDDKSKSYPAYLQKMVTGYTVINAGVSGDKTSDALARINEDVISHNPKIVIIELGANDLRSVISSDAQLALDSLPSIIASTKSNLISIIDKLNKNGVKKIYLAKFYNLEVAKGMLTSLELPESYAPLLISPYNKMFDEISKSTKAEIIEDFWAGVYPDHLSADGFHADSTGYRIMAENYFNAIEL